MQWSKLKKRIEAQFADALSGRVQVFETRYHGAHDSAGRWSLRIDGVDVEGFGDIPAEALSIVERYTTGNLSHYGFHKSAVDFLSLSVDAALESQDPLHRSLAILDSRLGKRRLLQLDAASMTTSLERTCFEVRMEAEGLHHRPPNQQ
jgi:hypothetical protein